MRGVSIWSLFFINLTLQLFHHKHNPLPEEEGATSGKTKRSAHLTNPIYKAKS